MKERKPKKLEAFQRGRRNELSDVVGKTVASVHDVGKDKVELLFADGTKLLVSGETNKSPTSIYYKIIGELTDEERKEIENSFKGVIKRVE